MPAILLSVFVYILLSDSFFKTFYSNTDLFTNTLSFLPNILLPTNELMVNPFLNITIAVIVLLVGIGTVCYLRKKITSWFMVIGILWMLIILLPSMHEIYLRQNEGLHTHGHDGGVIQTLEATQAVYLGQNPYEYDYSVSPMKIWGDPKSWITLGYPDGNPALQHVPYSPLSFLIHIPFEGLSNVLFGFYDPRMLYLLALILCAYVAIRIAPTVELKMATSVLLLFNPLVPLLSGYGVNDSILLFFLTLTMYGLVYHKQRLVMVALACAVSTKIIAIFFVPFVFMYYILQDSKKLSVSAITDWVQQRNNKQALTIFSVLVFMLNAPFIAWNPGAFYDDVIAFNNGTSAISYPIRGDGGYGFASLVLYFGLVDSVRDYFPFGIVQAAVIFVFGISMTKTVMKHKSAAYAFFAGLVVMIGFMYVSRFWHKNYFVYPIVMGWVVYLTLEHQKSSAPIAATIK